MDVAGCCFRLVVGGDCLVLQAWCDGIRCFCSLCVRCVLRFWVVLILWFSGCLIECCCRKIGYCDFRCFAVRVWLVVFRRCCVFVVACLVLLVLGGGGWWLVACLYLVFSWVCAFMWVGIIYLLAWFLGCVVGMAGFGLFGLLCSANFRLLVLWAVGSTFVGVGFVVFWVWIAGFRVWFGLGFGWFVAFEFSGFGFLVWGQFLRAGLPGGVLGGCWLWVGVFGVFGVFGWFALRVVGVFRRIFGVFLGFAVLCGVGIIQVWVC